VNAKRTFPQDVASITLARRFARDTLTDIPRDALDAVELMVSELATNSVKHGHSSFTLTIRLVPRQLRVEVYDGGNGRPALGSPAPNDPSGRGLQIVDALSSRWGADATSDGKLVWFELEDGRLS
jgi:anti-sigma regulatory factor (Ser/Thr protein kinase)